MDSDIEYPVCTRKVPSPLLEHQKDMKRPIPLIMFGEKLRIIYEVEHSGRLDIAAPMLDSDSTCSLSFRYDANKNAYVFEGVSGCVGTRLMPDMVETPVSDVKKVGDQAAPEWDWGLRKPGPRVWHKRRR